MINMNKLDFAFDPQEINSSTIKVFKYLASAEVKNFCEDECNNNHIFVDIIIMSMAFEARHETDMYSIYIV